MFLVAPLLNASPIKVQGMNFIKAYFSMGLNINTYIYIFIYVFTYTFTKFVYQ